MNPHPTTSTWQRFLDEELDPSQARRLAEHLESCAACTEVLSRMVESALDGRFGAVADGLRTIRPDTVAAAAKKRRHPRRLAVAGLAAAVLLAAFTLIDLRPVNADVILDRLGTGPRDVTSATYSSRLGEHEVVFGGPRTILMRRRAGGELRTVGVVTRELGWSFDVTADRLDLTTDGEESHPELSLLNPLDSVAFVSYLRQHCNVEYAGEVEEGGAPCWLLECEPRDERGMAGELVIDQTANIVRRIRADRLGSLGELRLLRTGEEVDEEDLLPTSSITPTTTVSIDRAGGESVVSFVGCFAASELPPQVAKLLGERSSAFARDVSAAERERLAGLAAAIARSFADGGRLEAFVEAAGFSLPQPADIAEALQQGRDELAPGRLPAGLTKLIDPKDLRGPRGLEELCRLLAEKTGVPIDLEAEAPRSVFTGLDQGAPLPAWVAIRLLAAIYGLEARVVDGRVELSPSSKSGSSGD